MSSVYTPTSVQMTTITIPSDGDSASAASVNAPFEALADGQKFLFEQIPTTQVISLFATPLYNTGARFTQATSPLTWIEYWTQADITDHGPIGFYHLSPIISRHWMINTVSLLIYPDVGPRAALPTLPHFTLSYLDSTGAVNTVAHAHDLSADVAAYETPHWIVDTSISETYFDSLGAAGTWLLEVSGEGGGAPNAVAGLKLGPLVINTAPNPL